MAAPRRRSRGDFQRRHRPRDPGAGHKAIAPAHPSGRSDKHSTLFPPTLPPLDRPVKERSERYHGDARERGDGPAQEEHDEKNARERDEQTAPESRERHPKVLAGKD